jgi:hypothetical protein
MSEFANKQAIERLEKAMAAMHREVMARIDSVLNDVIVNQQHLKAIRTWIDRQEAAANAGAGPSHFDQAKADQNCWGQ